MNIRFRRKDLIFYTTPPPPLSLIITDFFPVKPNNLILTKGKHVLNKTRKFNKINYLLEYNNN